MCGTDPKHWSQWLSFAELWYNINYHTTIKMTPFEALYGYKPTPVAFGPHLSTSVIRVEQTLTEKQYIQQHLKRLLLQAQDRIRTLANKHRSERHFAVGDWVCLKLKPYRQLTLHTSKLWKLSPKFAGPFLILAKIGEVAYRLQLPIESKVHPVFHVSLLKKRISPADHFITSLPPFDDDGKLVLQLVKVIARRMVKRNKYRHSSTSCPVGSPS